MQQLVTVTEIRSRCTLETVAGRSDLIIGQPDEYHFPSFFVDALARRQHLVLEKANRLAFLTTLVYLPT